MEFRSWNYQVIKHPYCLDGKTAVVMEVLSFLSLLSNSRIKTLGSVWEISFTGVSWPRSTNQSHPSCSTTIVSSPSACRRLQFVLPLSGRISGTTFEPFIWYMKLPWASLSCFQKTFITDWCPTFLVEVQVHNHPYHTLVVYGWLYTCHTIRHDPNLTRHDSGHWFFQSSLHRRDYVWKRNTWTLWMQRKLIIFRFGFWYFVTLTLWYISS